LDKKIEELIVFLMFKTGKYNNVDNSKDNERNYHSEMGKKRIPSFKESLSSKCLT